VRFPFSLFSREEQFFVLEVLPDRVGGVLLSLDRERNLTVRRHWDSFLTDGGSRRTDIIRRIRLNRFKGTVIIAADPSLAYTTVVPVLLERESDKPLAAIELENLLSQAVGRIFNQCRDAASRALGVDDLDAVLVTSRVLDFKVDGHRVMNPVGFRAATVDAVFDLTLTTRAVLAQVRSLIGMRHGFFFTEIGRAELVALRAIQEPPVHLVAVGVPQSSLLTLRKAAVGHSIQRMVLTWRSDTLRSAIADEWGVSATAAEELYAAYLRGDFSPRAARTMAAVLKPTLTTFFAGLVAHHVRGTVYLTTPLPLPLALPFRRGSVTITEPPLERILTHAGFTLRQPVRGIAPRELFRRLAPFFEFYYDRGDSEINRWLRRHLSWLGSSI